MPDTMHTHDIHLALRSPFVSDCVYVFVSLKGLAYHIRAPSVN